VQTQWKLDSKDNVMSVAHIMNDSEREKMKVFSL